MRATAMFLVNVKRERKREIGERDWREREREREREMGERGRGWREGEGGRQRETEREKERDRQRKIERQTEKERERTQQLLKRVPLRLRAHERRKILLIGVDNWVGLCALLNKLVPNCTTTL